MTLFKCFSGILRTCLCLLRCFCFYDFFFDVFIFNFKQILLLDLLFSVISFVLTPEAATRGVLYKKVFSKITQYLLEYACVSCEICENFEERLV